jgi:hypothetical protein
MCTNIPHWLLLVLLLAWPVTAILVYSYLWSRYMPGGTRRDHWGGYGAVIVLLASGVGFLLFLVVTCR